MIRLSYNARNVSTFYDSKLLRDPTFSHVLRDQIFGVDFFTVNCFEDSKRTFLFIVESISLCIHHFSTALDFSSEKYSGSTGYRNSWYSDEKSTTVEK